MYRIRRVANPGDDNPSLEVIRRLDELVFPGEAPEPTEGGYWWIVFRKDRPVAYAGLKPIEGNRGYLCRSGVIPSHRGNGLQKRLISIRLKLARKLGMREIVTYTNPFNAASINSLIHCGLRCYVPEKKWAGKDYLYWKVKL